MSQTMFCVAGMHCSGTSMFAKVLHESEICMGNPARFLKPANNNKLGHFEDEAFVNINNDVLRCLGGNWDSIPNEPSNWDQSFPSNGAIRLVAAASISEFKTASIFGWKDPRNCLTIPFWQMLIPQLRVIIVVRRPAEVCHSLVQRNNFPREKCMHLWTAHNLKLLADVPKDRRLICDMNAMQEDREHEVSRIMTFLGATPSSGQLQSAYEAVREDQRNVDVNRDSLPSVCVREKEIYEAMLAESEASLAG